MNGSWGTAGKYNVTLSFVNAKDFSESSSASKLRLTIASSASATYQTVAEVAANSTTLARVDFTFDVSKFVTPASLQKVYCKFVMVASNGSTLVDNNLTNGAIKSALGDNYATLAYVKANEPPSTLTFTTNNPNYQDFDKPLTISWNAVTQTGSYAPHHYKVWIRFSYDNGTTWVTDNNYIVKGWGIEGTSYTFTLKDLHLDTKNLSDYSRFKLKVGMATLDNKNGSEITRSSIKWFVMTPYVINTSSGNLSFHTANNGQVSIGINNVKMIQSTDNMKIKLLDDGSEWRRIFWHDVSTTSTWFANSTEAKDCNQSNRFSKLGKLDSYRYNGKYEFMLVYPRYSTTKYNRWIQTANPLTTIANATQTADTMGYRGVHIDFTTNWKYGIGLSSNSQAFMDCEAGHTNWYGGIGLYSAYQGGFPAPTENGMSNVQKEVELWVRLYNSVNIAPSTLNDTIYLRTSSDFYTFCNNINNGKTYKGKTVILLTDVSTSGANEHKDFNPAGDISHPFEGIFDGNGHTINMKYVENNEHHMEVGLFGVNHGTIKNLRVTNMYVNAYDNGGIICGHNVGIIENCCASGALIDISPDGTSKYLSVSAGGIAGMNEGIIRKCIANINISVSDKRETFYIGGITGYNYLGDIISCRTTGTITSKGAADIGGISGVSTGSIVRCVNYLNITPNASSGIHSGGIIGSSALTESGKKLVSCVNFGSGAKYGILGNNNKGIIESSPSGLEIINCYYANNYNSSGADIGDVTIPMSLSAMKSDDMANKLGSIFFFYDSSYDSYTSSSSKQFIKFNWEKVSGWSNGESCGTGKFYYSEWTAPATKITVITYEDWNSIGEKPTKFEFYYKNNLYKTIINPPRNISIDVYGSFTESTSDKIAVKWYGKTGLKLSKERLISYGAACFLEGTKVLTSNGLKAIEEISEGDYVLSRNEETGEIEEQIVYHTYNHNPRSCL